MPRFDVSSRQLAVAMDHGRTLGAIAGLEDPGRVLDTAIAAGADAIMTSFGVVKRYRERLIGRIPTIRRVDVLETYATGSAESFARVTSSCPARVLIAGGPRIGRERAVLQVVREALDAGGRGVVFGATSGKAGIRRRWSRRCAP